MTIANVATDANAQVEHISTLLYFTVPLIASIIGGLIANAFAFFVLRSTQQHEMRMAALDKRLGAHQEGFALWAKLYRKLHDDDKKDVVDECYAWWNNHCLYLSEPARTNFKASIDDVLAYIKYKGTADQIPAYQRIVDVFKYLQEGVGLPAISVVKNEKG